MSDKSQKDIIDEVFGSIEDLINHPHEPIEKRMVGFWLPSSYQERYEIIQAKTNREFGKKCIELLMIAIDRVDPNLK